MKNNLTYLIYLGLFGFLTLPLLGADPHVLTISNPSAPRMCYVGDPVGTLLDSALVFSSRQTTWNMTAIEIFIEDPSSILAPTYTASSNYEELTYDAGSLPAGGTGIFSLNTATSPDVKMLRFTFTAGTAISAIQTLLRTVRYRVVLGQAEASKTIYIIVQEPASPVKWSKQTIRPGSWPASVTVPRGLRFFRICSDPGYTTGWTTISSNIVASRNEAHFGLINGYMASIFTQDEHNAVFECFASSNIANNAYSGSIWLSGSDAALEGTWRWGNDPDGYSDTRFSIGAAAADGLFADWVGGQPDDSSSEDFLSVVREYSGWNDLPTNGTLPGTLLMYRAQDILCKVKINVVNQNALRLIRPL